uniref:Uncharacterized protein n=1 Tax=Panagrellus redivivus TaxID=6233 RepID=A0A7E4ZX17_PANRE
MVPELIAEVDSIILPRFKVSYDRNRMKQIHAACNPDNQNRRNSIGNHHRSDRRQQNRSASASTIAVAINIATTAKLNAVPHPSPTAAPRTLMLQRLSPRSTLPEHVHPQRIVASTRKPKSSPPSRTSTTNSKHT